MSRVRADFPGKAGTPCSHPVPLFAPPGHLTQPQPSPALVGIDVSSGSEPLGGWCIVGVTLACPSPRTAPNALLLVLTTDAD